MTTSKTFEDYDHPQSILADDTLSYDEKYDMLKLWEDNENALIRAASEGMQGGVQNHLKDVRKALETLKAHKEAS